MSGRQIELVWVLLLCGVAIGGWRLLQSAARGLR
ncbi:hypothetical protein P3T39_001512 [Kitasatospora sp. GP82]|nr:hypothetical protein [Kitasatospora sp. GP82]